MEPMFVVAVTTTLLFVLAKFIEYKYFQGEEKKPLKDTVRDTLIVMACALASSYVFFQFQGSINDFFDVVTESKVASGAATQVFTDKPNF
jgi:hypothetical protein|tara:strand:- start:5374 stop:5643 length:270 start_codon:yes stop_codon:yes gene_type:complete